MEHINKDLLRLAVRNQIKHMEEVNKEKGCMFYTDENIGEFKTLLQQIYQM